MNNNLKNYKFYPVEIFLMCLHLESEFSSDKKC